LFVDLPSPNPSISVEEKEPDKPKVDPLSVIPSKPIATPEVSASKPKTVDDPVPTFLLEC